MPSGLPMLTARCNLPSARTFEDQRELAAICEKRTVFPGLLLILALLAHLVSLSRWTIWLLTNDLYKEARP